MEGGCQGREPAGASQEGNQCGGADELSQCNEQLLVGPDWGHWGPVRDPCEEAGPLMGGQEAGEDGMFEGLRGLRAQRAGCVGIRIVP